LCFAFFEVVGEQFDLRVQSYAYTVQKTIPNVG